MLENYDAARIEVDPAALWSYYEKNLKVSIDEFALYIKSINGMWGDLKLGWAGQTKEEAESFFGRWDASMLALFGRDDGTTTVLGAEPEYPGRGEALLGKIRWAVGAVSENFANAEGTVKAMFQGFRDHGEGKPDPTTGPPAPNDVVDMDYEYRT